jgi:glycosyltransferase involved in cell wall biosynthesis
LSKNIHIIVANAVKQHTPELLKSLTGKGFNIKLFTLFSSDKHRLFIRLLPLRIQQNFKKRLFAAPDGLNIEDYPLLFFFSRLFIHRSYNCGNEWFDARVAKAIQRLDFDLLITYENSNLLTQQRAKKAGKVTILDLAQIHHVDILDSMRLFGTAEQVGYERDRVNPKKEAALGFTDYIFCLSDYAKASLVQHGFSEHRIFKMNLGVNLNRFAAKTSYHPKRQLEVLFVGTIMRRKGIGLLVDMFHKLKDLDIKWTIIGPPGDAIGLLPRNEPKLTYRPFMHHEELVEQYRQADVFIFPSFLDSWAQTVIEGMACGTPVIVSDHTGAKEAVEQGGGFVVPTGDVEAYVEKILYFFDHRDEVERMGRRAREIAQRYTWEHYAQQVTEAINAICERENITVS